MATSTVENTVLDISGVAVVGCEVTIDLIPGPAFKIDTDTEIASRIVGLTDINGKWSIALERTANITPSNTYYRVKEQIPRARGGPRIWYFTVPASSPVNLVDNIVNPNTSSGFIVPTIVTSSTRPSNPFAGQMIFETDTGKVLHYYGSTLGWLPNWAVPWGEVAFLAKTSDFTTSSTSYVDITGFNVTWTAINGRRYEISLNGGVDLITTATSIQCAITDNSNVVLNERNVFYNTTTFNEIMEFTFRTPGNESGSLTRKGRMLVGAGTATGAFRGSANHPSMLSVWDIGPAANPVIT